MKYYGLIIPRSYNDYYSRSDPQAIQEQMRDLCDTALDDTSIDPIQNKPVAEAIEAINDKIPTQATTSNKLADKAFVNSSVATNTANYISDNGQPFTSLAALEAYSGTLTNNDYAYVVTTDAAGNTVYNRYKYVDDGETTPAWAFEYALNNSSFTAAEWAAIQSGITAAAVARIPAGTVAEIDDTQVLSGKVWSSQKTSSFATAGVVCTTAAATQTKAVTLAGFTLAAGACIRVMFTNENTAANPELQINSESAKAIKVIQHGQKVAIPRHQGYWRGAANLSYEVWQPNTILELFYDGTDFIVIGNPIVESYEDTANNKNYIVYADGFIEQWGVQTTVSGGTVDFNYAVQFLRTFTFTTSFGYSGNAYATAWKKGSETDLTKCKLCYENTSAGAIISYKIIGY